MSEKKGESNGCGIIILIVIVLIVIGYTGIFTGYDKTVWILNGLLILGALLVGYLLFLALSNKNSNEETNKENLGFWGVVKYALIIGLIINFIRGCGDLDRFIN